MKSLYLTVILLLFSCETAVKPVYKENFIKYLHTLNVTSNDNYEWFIIVDISCVDCIWP